MARHAFLRWLLELLQKAPDPFLNPATVAAIAGDAPDAVEAIEVTVLGQRLRILVEEIG
jgi:hypothetical protein